LLIIVIPAYNEEQNIGTLLENILHLGYKSGEYSVLVVNDGSQDNTVGIVESYKDKMPVSIVSHQINQGVGAVFRTGFSTALEMAKPDDVIVTMEADNTSDLAILPKMVAGVKRGNDLMLASCYARGGKVEGTNFWRRLLSWGANFILVLFFPIRGVKTYSSFYRAYNAESLRRAFQVYDGNLIEQPGFVCMVELLIKMHRLGVRISEIPMILRINMRKDSSKMRVIKTIQGYINFIVVDFRQRIQASARKKQ
jgi:dolichol-phosphate mannosyltransferase